jgi:hypothetical protein
MDVWLYAMLLSRFVFPKEALARHVGIGIRTNRFTCRRLGGDPKSKRMETFDLDQNGLQRFHATIGEAAVNAFSFAALFGGMVGEVVVANTCQLKSVGVPGKKTDKIDAAKLAEKLKAQAVSGSNLKLRCGIFRTRDRRGLFLLRP